jgi:ABC-2 type transport system permease protein
MTTATATAPAGPARRAHDVWAMTRRNLVHISREPAQLSDVTVQPLLFTALFVYIFGGGIPIPHGTYKDFVLAGLLSLNLVTSTMGTGVGLSTDLHEGIIDRFRALPMWRASVLVGRSLADLATFLLCALIVSMTGLVVGWRPEAGLGSIIGGFVLVLFFAYSLTWIAICVGLNSKSPESAASIGFVVVFPLAFVSNAMIPTQHMPQWLRDVADWNPVSAVTAGARHLWGNPNPSATISAWPMQHPVLASLAWSACILAVAAPCATWLFRRRTTELGPSAGEKQWTRLSSLSTIGGWTYESSACALTAPTRSGSPASGRPPSGGAARSGRTIRSALSRRRAAPKTASFPTCCSSRFPRVRPSRTGSTSICARRTSPPKSSGWKRSAPAGSASASATSAGWSWPILTAMSSTCSARSAETSCHRGSTLSAAASRAPDRRGRLS